MNIKDIIIKYEKPLSRIYRAFFNLRGFRFDKKNKISYGSSFCKNLKFDIKGNNNEVLFVEGGLTRVNDCRFSIHGSNNKIIIHGHVVIDDCDFCMEDDNNVIEIFNNTWINPKVEFAAIEGTRIVVGKDCMFSAYISLRTGDSHSVLNAETGLRINPSKDIIISDHVWVGSGATILKGTVIGEDCVVSAKAVLAGKSFPHQSIIAGLPGEVKKRGITWDRKRSISLEGKNNL